MLPMLLSGRGEGALRAQSGRLADFLERHPELPTDTVADMLAGSRTVFEHRAAVTADDRIQLLARLRTLAHTDLDTEAGTDTEAGVVRGTGRRLGDPALVFPGQGAQWPTMAVKLLDDNSNGPFAQRLQECRQALQPFVDWDLFAVLRGEPGTPDFDRVDVVQPALWAVKVSLAAQWHAAGIRPAAVIGHSQGEIAAATVSGALTLTDGARVVALRSRLLSRIAGQGGMISLALPRDQAETIATDLGLDIGAVNSPANTVLSGPTQALDQLTAWCEKHETRYRRVPIDYASHSTQVETIKDQLLEALAPITPRSGNLPFYSSLTGGPVDGAELDADYWYNNLRHTVDYAAAIRALAHTGITAFIEVSPHPVLTLPTQETLQTLDNLTEQPAVLATLHRDHGDTHDFTHALSTAWTQGITLRPPTTPIHPDLPTYPFQGTRHWLNAPSGGDPQSFGLRPVVHPLLGAAIHRADEEGVVFTGRVSTATHPWLADHVVRGSVLFPGTAFVEAAIRAGDEVGTPCLEELILQAPLVVAAQQTVSLQVTVGAPDASGRRAVSVHSAPQSGAESTADPLWSRHAHGFLVPALPDDTAAAEALATWPPPGAEAMPVADAYERMAQAGYGYGPAFQGLRAVWRRNAEIFAEIALPEGERTDGWSLHPALLDAALHPDVLGEVDKDESQPLSLPFSWHDVRLHASGATTLRVRLTRPEPGGVALLAVDPAGALVVSVTTLVTRPMAEAASAPDETVRQMLLHTQWQPVTTPPEPQPAGRWLAVGPDAAHFASALTGAGFDAHGVPDLAADTTEPAPDTLLLLCDRPGPEAAGTATAVHARVQLVLAQVQHWLRDERYEATRLVLATRGAVAADPASDVADLAGASVWGLARTVQAEHPGRLVLIDLDPESDTPAADVAGLHAADMTGLHAADMTAAAADVAGLRAAVASGEPQTAVRAGLVLAPSPDARGRPGLRRAAHARSRGRHPRHRRDHRPGPARRPAHGRRARRPPPAAAEQKRTHSRRHHRPDRRTHRPGRIGDRRSMRRGRPGRPGHCARRPRPAPDRRGAQRRRPRRRDGVRSHPGAGRHRAAAQGGRGTAPAPPHARRRPDTLRPVLVDRRHPGRSGTGQLRRGQRLPRRPRGAPALTRTARHRGGLGPLGRRRPDRTPERHRPRPHRPQRRPAARRRSGTGASRRRPRPPRGRLRRRALRPRRPAAALRRRAHPAERPRPRCHAAYRHRRIR